MEFEWFYMVAMLQIIKAKDALSTSKEIWSTLNQIVINYNNCNVILQILQSQVSDKSLVYCEV